MVPTLYEQHGRLGWKSYDQLTLHLETKCYAINNETLI